MLENQAKHTLTILGPFQVNRKHFVTRHPLPITTGIKPFSSLSHKFWLNYSTLYLMFTLASISMALLSQTNSINTITVTQWLKTIIDPNDSLWLNIFKSGLLYKAIFSFSFWSCDLLYGMDLWSALVGQRFETKVDYWANITWFDTRFVLVDIQHMREISNSLLEFNLMTFYLYETKQNKSQRTQLLPSFEYEFTKDNPLLHYFNLAQDSANPSDVIFLLTENEYITFGLDTKRQRMPFSLRISEKPVKSYAGVNEKMLWNTLRHSLLNEPIARTILWLQVIYTHEFWLIHYIKVFLMARRGHVVMISRCDYSKCLGREGRDEKNEKREGLVF